VAKCGTSDPHVDRWSVLAAIGAAAAMVSTAAAVASAAPPARSGGCALSGPIKHVIYLQFDNTHYTRDDPNVPSDLEQMPNPLNFLTDDGTLVSHEHTPLISHTANDIVTSETGVYGDRHGDAIANEYRYYTPSGGRDTAGPFAYWTDPIVDFTTANSAPVGDGAPTMVDPSGGIAPAPWVPYARGLRLRHGGIGQHRVGEHGARRGGRVRRELGAGHGGG
jgi:hypothetical protein